MSNSHLQIIFQENNLFNDLKIETRSLEKFSDGF